MEEMSYRFSELLASLPHYPDLSGSFEEQIDEYVGRILEDGNEYGFDKNGDKEQIRFIAGLRLKFGRNVLVHQIDDVANEKIHTTDLPVIPEKLPSILEGPYVIEEFNNEALFDNIIGIYGFRESGLLMIAFMRELDEEEGNVVAVSTFFSIEEDELRGRDIEEFVGGMKMITDEGSKGRFIDEDMLIENRVLMQVIKYVLIVGNVFE